MGKLARIVDWTQDEPNAVPRAFDSGVCLKALSAEPEPDDGRFDGDFDEDTPTRPYQRIAAPRAKEPCFEIDRSMTLAVARLGTLANWLSEGEDAASVVAFVRRFLASLEELNFAIGLLREKAAGSIGIGEPAEAFCNAASVWRANLVEYVDELALTEYRSLDAWSSLPSYSSTYVLAFISPTLGALKDRMAARDGREGAELLPCAWAIEAAVVRLNWVLSSIAPGGVEELASRQTMLASGW